jgi:hypothetical protein
MTTLRARTVYADDKLTVTAVESLAFHADRTKARRFVTASLAPIAIIVRKTDRTYALDMDAQPVDIDALDLPADFGGE